MDARALLQSQGWRGSGHSLHATDDRIGLAKPLLLNRKDNTKGLGTKAHFTSDTWWMNAFDEQLQGLDTSKPGQVTQTVTAGRLNQIEKVSGGKWMLYASFVKGGFLEGTIEGLERKKEEEVEERVREVTGAVAPQSWGTSIENMTTTKREVDGKGKKAETKEERRARKAAKAARKTAREARRVDRAAKKVLKEEKRARREVKKVKREARKAEKAKKGVSG
ncbi:hypothetical protein COL5a_011348 [Colletotrichum fioriniae]|uniref:uncharacterized protein n=1 Tax=Colletotrichum fioriniae TaxID=710243 RepID=UPI0022FFE128|nr:uncharacterized protein COL516b_006457 [Colletotrichum fioriniae]KAJ0303454.1 hypothetical protein COL516b_006457 [Colletotrichum fioriniae]KAJ0316889.1 hypothetical protein COL5a_011348 [Colletotrichum fioriniae]KAJ3949398.1 hypothetical protein N0V96_000515 [Colletotrichum fioriniae]